jgi:hypothetical protein
MDPFRAVLRGQQTTYRRVKEIVKCIYEWCVFLANQNDIMSTEKSMFLKYVQQS